MRNNTLAKDFLDHLETSSNDDYRRVSSPQEATDSMDSPQTTPISDKVTHFTNFDRGNKIKEKEVGWWIGNVTAIREETFDAVMEELHGQVSVVEFEKELMDPYDQDLLFVNSIFTYAISLIDKPDGREYKTKFAFSSRRKWLEEYEIKAKSLTDEYFPDSLLSL